MQKGKPLAVSYTTNEAKRFKRDFSSYVRDEVKKQGWETDIENPRHYYVDATFYFPRSDMDANNYFKVMLDAITESNSIWKDDNVVCERVQAIYYDADNPRVELCIHPVDYIGVFKDASQLAEFESRCVACKRYKRNCSILRGALVGKIQTEIKDNQCAKFQSCNGSKE